jgi:hypothetical protein
MRAVRLLALCLVVVAALPGEASAGTRACRAQVTNGVIPSWARAGFSDPKPRMPHVLGASGNVVALIFGYPLYSPPLPKRSNKILWVARVQSQPLSDLHIRAQRMRGTRSVGPRVTRTVIGGPGPSIIDLPAAGCWRLTLRWSGRTDTLDLQYARP